MTKLHITHDLAAAASCLRTVSEIPLSELLPLMGQAERVLLADIIHYAGALDKVVKARVDEESYV